MKQFKKIMSTIVALTLSFNGFAAVDADDTSAGETAEPAPADTAVVEEAPAVEEQPAEPVIVQEEAAPAEEQQPAPDVQVEETQENTEPAQTVEGQSVDDGTEAVTVPAETTETAVTEAAESAENTESVDTPAEDTTVENTAEPAESQNTSEAKTAPDTAWDDEETTGTEPTSTVEVTAVQEGTADTGVTAEPESTATAETAAAEPTADPSAVPAMRKGPRRNVADGAASINGTQYENLTTAYAALKEGETIVLLKDGTDDDIPLPAVNYTLDLNGHSYGGNGFYTVQRNVKITNSSDTAASFNKGIQNYGGTLDVEGKVTLTSNFFDHGTVTFNNTQADGAVLDYVDWGRTSIATLGSAFTASAIKYTQNKDMVPSENKELFFSANDLSSIITEYRDRAESKDISWKDGKLVLNKDTETIAYAAKINDTEYKTVSAAIAAAKTDDVIVLEADANEGSTTVLEGKSITIDLNGKNYSTSDWFFISGDLTLTNNAETAASVNIAFVNYNTFHSSGKIDLGGSFFDRGTAVFNHQQNNELNYINWGRKNTAELGADFSAESIKYTKDDGKKLADDEGEVLFNGGSPKLANVITATGKNDKNEVFTFNNICYENNQIVFKRGAVTASIATIGDHGFGTLQDAVSNAASSGDTIVLQQSIKDSTELTVPEGKSVTIDLNGKSYVTSSNIFFNGTVLLKNSDHDSPAKISSTGYTQNNGTLNTEGDLSIEGSYFDSGTSVFNHHQGSAELNYSHWGRKSVAEFGSEFTADSIRFTYNFDPNPLESLTLFKCSSGKYLQKLKATRNNLDCKDIRFVDGQIIAVPDMSNCVAVIGLNGYTSLQAAFNAAKDEGDTVKIVQTEVVDSTDAMVPSGKTVTLDLNGSSYKNSGWFTNNGDLTIINSSETPAVMDVTKGFANNGTFKTNGNLTLKGAYFDAGISEFNNVQAAELNYDNFGRKDTATLSSGFSAPSIRYAKNSEEHPLESDMLVLFKGGSSDIAKTVKASRQYKDENGTIYNIPYQNVEYEDSYGGGRIEIKLTATIGDFDYPSVQMALEAAKNNDIIKLQRDIDETQETVPASSVASPGDLKLTKDKSVTLDLNGQTFKGDGKHYFYIDGTLNLINTSSSHRSEFEFNIKVW